MTTNTTRRPARNSRDTPTFDATARKGSTGHKDPSEPSAAAEAPPGDDPLAVGAELDALRALRTVVAERVRTAPAYTLDRLTRELRQIVRAITDLEATAAGPASDTVSTDWATVFAARERLVLDMVAAGAEPDAAIAAAKAALPTPPGAPFVDDMAADYRLTSLAHAAPA